jgi:hypothetical protein
MIAAVSPCTVAVRGTPVVAARRAARRSVNVVSGSCMAALLAPLPMPFITA